MDLNYKGTTNIAYSCFPIVPKLACQHLGLPILDSPKPITLLGGLTSFGGAGNNYSLHASSGQNITNFYDLTNM